MRRASRNRWHRTISRRFLGQRAKSVAKVVLVIPGQIAEVRAEIGDSECLTGGLFGFSGIIFWSSVRNYESGCYHTLRLPDVIKILDVPKPAPAAGEVLVRIHATTVNRTDCGELRPRIIGRLFGLRRPRRTIFGMDFAGVVEAAGPQVKSFKPGDRVFGMCPSRRNGAHAEYVCIPESAAIAIMPANTHFDEAVVCEGAFYANSGLRKFHVGPGHKILIYGASGAIGSAAVQLAKACGAEVTAVVATRHLEAGQIPRRGPRHRLYGGGFHPHRRAFRFRLRGGGESQLLSMPQTPEVQRDVHGDRHRSLGGVPADDDLVGDRTEQQSPRSPAPARQRPSICRIPESTHGGGSVSRGHRSKIPARRDRRRLSLCRDGAKGWHRRDRCRRRRRERAHIRTGPIRRSPFVEV